ncbi:MAG: hypothetical protein WCK68_04805 [Betaproteobacteria bacterium]
MEKGAKKIAFQDAIFLQNGADLKLEIAVKLGGKFAYLEKWYQDAVKQ